MLSAVNCSEKLSNPCNLPGSAYVHIPFCRRRCFYCDFPIAVVGDKPPVAQKVGIAATNSNSEMPSRSTGSGFATISHYVEVLCQEIGLTFEQEQAVRGQALTTVFLGGGTPSLLTVEQLQQILNTLDQLFGIAADAEISMEIDPGTFDLAQIQGYRSAGVNRVSLGVQAFQPQLLQACGRSHTVEDIYAAVDLVHQAEIVNFSLDLISGLPHQTLEDWQQSLEQAIALQPTHLSCYDLTVEPITAFGRQYKPGVSPLPSDDLTAEMYRVAQQTLTAAGYDHYEISNYAKPGYQCRHNRVYWENLPFYGFGMGATSYVQSERFSRPRKTREYYEWVKEQTNQVSTGAEEIKLDKQSSTSPLTPDLNLELLLDTLMLGLRLADGLSLAGLIEQFGREALLRVWKCLHPYYQQGWVEVVGHDRLGHDQLGHNEAKFDVDTLPEVGQIRLSDPEGFLFSNVVLVDLFEEFE